MIQLKKKKRSKSRFGECVCVFVTAQTQFAALLSTALIGSILSETEALSPNCTLVLMQMLVY